MNTITTDLSKVIRQIESKLISKFELDRNDNSFAYNKMFNTKLCHDILDNCVLPKACKRIFDKYIKPIYFYLEYANNYLTVECIAEHNNLSVFTAKLLINDGRDLLNELVSIEKA